MPINVLTIKLTVGQFRRYVAVGFMNSAIDFAVLNLLSWATGITKGDGLIPINMISFCAAIINSFYFNKRWSFDDQSQGQNAEKFTIFLIVSLIGAIANTAIVRYISTNVDPRFGLSPQLWLNAAKVIATLFTFAWNFSGYKTMVFKK